MTEASTPPNRAPWLRGVSVVGGRSRGPALVAVDLAATIPVRRVPAAAGSRELGRLTRALGAARAELEALRERLRGGLCAAEVQRLTEHSLAFKNPVLLADIEALVIGEQLGLESAIAKVLLELGPVQGLADDRVREAATCLLSQLVPPQLPAAPHVFVGRTLTLGDLVPPGLRGAVCEEALRDDLVVSLGRRLGVPMIAGVERACCVLRTGDDLTLDGAEGWVRVGTREQRGDVSELVIDTPAAYFRARSCLGSGPRLLVDLDRLHALWSGVPGPVSELDSTLIEALTELVRMSLEVERPVCIYGALATSACGQAALQAMGVQGQALKSSTATELL